MKTKEEILSDHLTKNGVTGFIDGDRIYKSCYDAMDEFTEQQSKEIAILKEKLKHQTQ